jgi:hypothetical protein
MVLPFSGHTFSIAAGAYLIAKNTLPSQPSSYRNQP